MSENNFLSFVSDRFKHEYQEGTATEVEINCAGGKKLLVCYLALTASFVFCEKTENYHT